jgi:hypothetical protein
LGRASSRLRKNAGEVEEFVDESRFASNPGVQNAMAAADHPHHLEAFDRGIGGLYQLEAERPGQPQSPLPLFHNFRFCGSAYYLRRRRRFSFA